MSTDFLNTFGLNDYWVKKFKESQSNVDDQILSRVVTRYSGKDVVIATQEGLKNSSIAGKLFKDDSNQNSPVPGDWVVAKKVGESEFVVEKILERRSVFFRKKPSTLFEEQVIAANLDKLFVVTSMNSDFNPSRLERYITQADKCEIEVVIILSKQDLTDNPEYFRDTAKKVLPGGSVICTSALVGEAGLKELYPELLPGETVGFVGSSGVGKSTIINALLGREAMETKEVSPTTDKGRHTTTRRELIPLDMGTVLLDTPGMREFGIVLDYSDKNESFADINHWSALCAFNNCTHSNEKGCAVREAVQNGLLEQKRLDNFRKINFEQKFLWVKGRRIDKKKLKYGKKGRGRKRPDYDDDDENDY